MENKKIQSFTDLIVWQKAHSFVLLIYQVTRKFPQDERYCLTDQLRRAVISITSNIVEGFYRRTINDKKHFYNFALSSLGEVRNQILIAKDLGYISTIEYHKLAVDATEIKKLLNAFIVGCK